MSDAQGSRGLKQLITAAVEAILLSGLSASLAVAADASPQRKPFSAAIEGSRHELAVLLDQAGKLNAALEVYQQQAESMPTADNQFTYAGALLRAGRGGEAKRVYDRLLRGGSAPDQDEARLQRLMVCGSHMVRNGSPQLAIEYLRPAYKPASREVAIGLLLAHAQCAAGDVNGARVLLQQIDKDLDTWEVGLRTEFARLKILTGDLQRGRDLLAGIDHAVGQLYRDSIIANLSLRDREWAKASATLAAAEVKAPRGIDAKQVARQWRTVQREVRSMQLRRAIALWKEGERDPALSELIKAQMTDEEYVRSAALVLQVANDLLVEKNQSRAFNNLDALAGHDVRLAQSIAHLKSAISGGAEAQATVAELKNALAQLDHTSDWATAPLFEILSEAVTVSQSGAATNKAPARSQ